MEASRRGSEQMAHGSASVNAPQTEQSADFFARLHDDLGQAPDDIGIALHQMQGQALGRTRADARQAAQRLGQRRDGFGQRH